jgi:D-alanyl-D-alanine carboxypeptidase (penicillin-binding protein 5/6)
VFGVKTGSTDQAGGNLVFASKLAVGGKMLTVVGAVFNQPGADTPEQLAEVDKVVMRLLAKVKDTVKTYQLLPADPVGTVSAAWGGNSAVRLAKALTVIGWPGLKVSIQVTKSAPGAETRSGQVVVGAVEAQQARVDLVSDDTIEPDLWWKLSRRR